MLYHVQIVARDIQVTADDSDEAERFAKDDVREFYADWSYLVDEVRPALPGEERTTDEDDLDLEVEQVEFDDEQSLYTFDATLSLVVDTISPETAGDAAKFFYKLWKYGVVNFDREVGPAAIAKIMELGEKQDAGAAEAEAMVSHAYNALVDIPSTYPGYEALERILACEKRWQDYDDEDAGKILSIAVQFGPEQPATAPAPR